MAVDRNISATITKLYYLNIYDEKSHLKFLINSASDVSYILLTNNVKKLKPDSLQFAASNSKIYTYVSKHMNVDLGLQLNFIWKFLIVNIPVSIIGADFLYFGILIILKARNLQTV